MEDNKSSKSVVAIIIVVVIVLIGGYFLLSGGSGGGVSGEKAVTPPPPQLAPALQLTPAEKRGDVADKRAEVLALVRSGKPLTQEQKAEIGGIMLTKASIYNFTEAERIDIFKALSK